MKKIYLFAVLIMALQTIASATTHTITTSGFAFSPDSINANVGDTIIFNVAFGTHPLQQVSSTTWAANGTTPLSGGFSATSGTTFSVVMTQAQVGVVYYVCTNHVASFGMKGRIFVSAVNGIENIPTISAQPYPNPANQQLHLVTASSGYFSYTITDMLGQTVLQGSEYALAQSAVTVNVSTVPEGNYILSTTNAEGLVSKSKIDIRR
jgi:plastocyanin